MSDIQNLTTDQLRRVLAIKLQIEQLQGQLLSIMGDAGISTEFTFKRRKRRRMSAAGRAKIAAAQRARWAKVKGKAKPAKSMDRRRSPAVRAKLAAAARARWRKAKAAGKTTL
jgi:hypothetical protein